MIRSIFYKSKSRDEDSLSYRFLAIYKKLSSEARSLLLRNCGLRFLPDMGTPSNVVSQVQLGTGKPDGLIRFTDMVVAFENKVDTDHKIGSKTKPGQLENYYKQLTKISENPRLLVAADRKRQNRECIQSVIKYQGIQEDHVDIIIWQEVHHACVKLIETWTSDTISEIDRFLIDELRILLEEMKMKSFTGIKLEQLQGYARSWNELTLLGQHLKETVQKEFSMLKAYTGQYGSFHRKYLGFGFPAEWEHTAWLYVLMSNDEFLKIGIELEDDRYSQPTSRLMKKGILEKLVPALEAAEGFEVQIGPEKISIDHVGLVGKLQEYRSGNLKTFFDGYLRVERRYPFKELQDDIGLDTPMFPEKLMVEISKLKRIASIINKGLMGKA